MRGALSQYLDEAYSWQRDPAQNQTTGNPTKTDLIEQIVAQREPEVQLQFLVEKLAELELEDAELIVKLHRQTQRGEAWTDDQKELVQALVKQIG